MDPKEYNTNLRKISEAQTGLEMVTHIQKCPTCAKILNDAQMIILKHIEQTRGQNE